MYRNQGRRFASATVAVLLCSTFSHARDEAFDVHLKAAQQNEETAAGRLYAAAFQKEFGAGFAPRLNACVKRTGGPRSDPFDLLLKLGATGKVDKVLVRPRIPFSACFAEASRKATFPKPPTAGYWVVAPMRFVPQ
jgi:hypothetical protein